MVQLAKYDAFFTVRITSNESVLVTKETVEQVRKTLDAALNDAEGKVHRKLKTHFDLHQDDVHCEVSGIILKQV